MIVNPQNFKIKTNTILKGNALEVLKTLPDNFIDCVMTSPPYYDLRDYGSGAISTWGGSEICNHEWVKNQESGFCVKCGAWRGQLGLEPSCEMYVQHLTQIFAEVKRVLKKSGSLWLNIGDTYFTNHENLGFKGILTSEDDVYNQKCLMGIPWRVAFALIKNGWILRNAVIWHKPNHMPASVKDRLANTYEYIFHFVKAQKYYNLDAIRLPHKTTPKEKIQQNGGKSKYKLPDPSAEKFNHTDALRKNGYHEEGKNPGDFWAVNTRPYFDEHFAVFPPELCIMPILATCPPDGIVMDTFAGSGTTLSVAKVLGRKYVGIEIEDKYIELAEERLKRLERPLAQINKLKDAEKAVKRIFMGDVNGMDFIA